MKLDLHMHTTHSDGQYTVEELLRQAQEKKLDIISITDHATMDAYETMKHLDVKALFGGKIVPGVEIYSYYDNKVIEILAYGVNIERMNAFLNQTYGKEWNENKRKMVVEELKKIADKHGIYYEKDFNFLATNLGECSSFIRHIKQFPKNETAIGPEIWNGETNFFRRGVNNKDSIFFVDYSKFYLPPEQIIQKVHQEGGICFLAHTYVYAYEDETKLLDYVKKHNIDGIECYYPTFSKEQCEFLLDYCNKHNLLISAGSDYHGPRVRSTTLGVTNAHVSYHPSDFAWLSQTKFLQTTPNLLKNKMASKGNEK